MVVLDTTIIIDHLRQSNEKTTLLSTIASKYPVSSLAITTITVQELYEGTSTRIPEKEKDLLAIITPLKILPYTFDVAVLAGTIARDLSHPIELADAAIAATCIYYDYQLATLNQKDFQGIPQLTLYQT
jgi:predicted nucleic acid-binding protein